MDRENIIKLTTTALTFPILFFLLAYFNEDGTLSMLSFLSYFLLAVVGGLIGAIYAYYGHNWFFKNSFIAGFIPSLAIMLTIINTDVENFVLFGDLCLIVSCWTTGSEVAFIKNKAV